MEQTEMVLNHLYLNGSITPKDAEEQYGIMRLAAVIFKLRKLGYEIKTVQESGKNRFGRTVSWARYVLEGIR